MYLQKSNKLADVLEQYFNREQNDCPLFCLGFVIFSHFVVFVFRRPQVFIASEAAQHVWLAEALEGKVSHKVVQIVSCNAALF